MPQPPLSLSDEEYSAVMAAASPVHPSQRDEFLRTLADEIVQQPAIGVGLVHRLAADLQRRYIVEARDEAAARDVPRHFRQRQSVVQV